MPGKRDWALLVKSRSPAPRRRFVYSIGYLLMAVAGVAAGLWPSPSVSNAAAASQYLVTVWNVFLVLGGVAASIGSATERWIGEYTGLPLLTAVFAVYGVASIASGRTTAYPAGAAFIGIALLLLGRWLDTAAAKKLATAAGRLDHDTTKPPQQAGWEGTHRSGDQR